MEGVMDSLGVELGRVQQELLKKGSSFSKYMVQKYATKLSSKSFIESLLIGQNISLALHIFLAQQGLVPFDTFILTPHNDTLNHEHKEVCALIDGVPFPLKKSAILFKQMAITMSPIISQRGLYFFQDLNFRGEKPTGTDKDNFRSWEFTQTDLEIGVKRSDPDFWINFITCMMREIFNAIHRNATIIFDTFGIDFPDFPKNDIPVFNMGDMIKEHGNEPAAEVAISHQTDSPIAIVTNLPREFYDKREGEKFLNFDILMRNGTKVPFMEIASGAFLRTHDYREIIERMLELKNITAEPVIEDGVVLNSEKLAGFGPFIEFAYRHGGLRMSGGFGVGDKRMLAVALLGQHVKGIHDVMAWSRDPREKHQLL